LHWDLYTSLTIGLVPHEMGHWYHGEFMEQNRIQWVPGKENSPRSLGARLVAEGVAAYLETLLDPNASHLNDPLLSNPPSLLNPYEGLINEGKPGLWIYPAGETFVRPILDTNFRKGLTLISKNPPRLRTVEDIEKSQRRFLERLNEGKH
jgi:hypothetical protein